MDWESWDVSGLFVSTAHTLRYRAFKALTKEGTSRMGATHTFTWMCDDFETISTLQQLS